MSKNDPKLQLELLVPWDLPTEQKLSSTDQVKLTQSLERLLLALKQPVYAKSIELIKESLNILGTVEVFACDSVATSSKTSLKNWEIQDYDTYFEISHVCTQDIAICLVRSVLIAYQNFLMLTIECSDLDPMQIERQKQGFISYACLLARVFQLDLEKQYD
ncbi:hypothetical protein [Gloeocapsa sp. PCC 73106]|uniref:hypothetical protein n=1 Tax=Gloeocapsa sp. PCC 73106 TaxID=102232 RepID=UPI0002AC5F6E|nr:hypothetical protein [Gloeocapsa sp. PCC 73106]ELR97041.1 hypothetical protein GLO73106DRAFT_00008440 [Gloeocapsa sp. PCC 73106]